MSDNGVPISDDELLRRASAWLVTDTGESPYTRDLIAMLSERLSALATPASAPVGETTEKGLLYVGTDYHTSLYRNVTVSLELAASELADLAEEHEAADRAVRFIGDALKECWRIMHVNSPACRAARAAERQDQEEGR